MIEPRFGAYEMIAPEYYDPVRHPTCHNFREASSRIVASWIGEIGVREKFVCDVGAGKSLVAEIMAAEECSPAGLYLYDLSPSMLAHSQFPDWLPVRLLIGDARSVALRSESLELLVASLGDPFNCEEFWYEVYRVLRPGGLVVFTTPSYSWAAKFRSRHVDEEFGLADFVVGEHEIVQTPSYIFPATIQRLLMEKQGLSILAEHVVGLTELDGGRVSPKLLINGPDLEVVHGYLAWKPD